MDRGKYRAKLEALGQEGDGDWVYGHYCKIRGTHFIIPDYADFDCMEEDLFEVTALLGVDGDTVGQYTDYTTHKGKDVYEGDGGNKPNNGTHIWGRYIVKFGRFMHDSHEYIGYYLDWLDAPVDELSVSITDHLLDFDMNIHDNPELLEQQ